jgi:hypothetical protein
VRRVRGRENSDWGKGRISHWKEEGRERPAVELRLGLGLFLAREEERGGGRVESDEGVGGFTREGEELDGVKERGSTWRSFIGMDLIHCYAASCCTACES